MRGLVFDCNRELIGSYFLFMCDLYTQREGINLEDA